ncbi:hypothetical protein BURKHO8Y_10400 [Burkholderia sp. 8Y]|nr:hypothetical protein BURKHO8Y_10400 [Burkholderia sp. 8Y]
MRVHFGRGATAFAECSLLPIGQMLLRPFDMSVRDARKLRVDLPSARRRVCCVHGVNLAIRGGPKVCHFLSVAYIPFSELSKEEMRSDLLVGPMVSISASLVDWQVVTSARQPRCPEGWVTQSPSSLTYTS